MTVTWVKVEEQLKDGSNVAFLCDVIVPDAKPGDWQQVLDLLHEHQRDWHVEYIVDGEVGELPRTADDLVARSSVASVRISTNVSGLPIFGHVFADDWIEFDVPASDIDGQERLDMLVDFVVNLGRALGKQVRATPEAAHDAPIFTYEPTDDTVHPA